MTRPTRIRLGDLSPAERIRTTSRAARAYNAGKSMRAVGETLRMTPNAIGTLLREGGVTIRHSGTPTRQTVGGRAFMLTTEERDRLRTKVAADHTPTSTITQLAKAHGIAYDLTRSLLREAGITPNRGVRKPRRRTVGGKSLVITPEQRAELRDTAAAEYTQDLRSLRNIAIRHGLTPGFVRTLLAEAGVPMRTQQPAGTTDAQ